MLIFTKQLYAQFLIHVYRHAVKIYQDLTWLHEATMNSMQNYFTSYISPAPLQDCVWNIGCLSYFKYPTMNDSFPSVSESDLDSGQNKSVTNPIQIYGIPQKEMMVIFFYLLHIFKNYSANTPCYFNFDIIAFHYDRICLTNTK